MMTPEEWEVEKESSALRGALMRKLNAAIASLENDGHIAKKGRNTNQNYDFLRETDAVAAIRPCMLASGLTMVPTLHAIESRERETSNGGKEQIVRVVMNYLLTDIATGYAMQFQVPGEGADRSDKAVYKAMTGAKKYFLLMLFWLATGDDPEKDTETDKRNSSRRGKPKEEPPKPDEPITPQLQAQLGKIMKQAGHSIEHVKEWIAREYGVESLKEVLHKDYQAIADRLANTDPLLPA